MFPARSYCRFYMHPPSYSKTQGQERDLKFPLYCSMKKYPNFFLAQTDVVQVYKKRGLLNMSRTVDHEGDIIAKLRQLSFGRVAYDYGQVQPGIVNRPYMSILLHLADPRCEWICGWHHGQFPNIFGWHVIVCLCHHCATFKGFEFISVTLRCLFLLEWISCSAAQYDWSKNRKKIVSNDICIQI